jgi:hypothetical protein
LKIESRIESSESVKSPEPWDEDWGTTLPLGHVICYDLDGAAHTVSELIWPWTAYTSDKKACLLHFFYWKPKNVRIASFKSDVTPGQEKYVRELQFLMTRQIYYGSENAPDTLRIKLEALHHIARFAEVRSCSVFDVLTNSELLDSCGLIFPDAYLYSWTSWLSFLNQLNPDTQLGFSLAKPKQRKNVVRRKNRPRSQVKQYAPLPTRIYAALINNLSVEIKDFELHQLQLQALAREAIVLYRQAKARKGQGNLSTGVGSGLVEKHGLSDFFAQRGYCTWLAGITGAIGEILQLCKLQIHVYSGMRDTEARNLPFFCMYSEKGIHKDKHCLIEGSTTKLNKGRRLRTKWVTTEGDGFRAIRLAQTFAKIIYDGINITPSESDEFKDNYPLFPSNLYLPWEGGHAVPANQIVSFETRLSRANPNLKSRLFPVIEEADIAELEEIDPFRAWREEPKFAVGQHWPLTTHQLRRSLAVYANASGLVRLSSLRRQLQHLTREMAMYYGRGSIFCKNFIAEDPLGFKKHVATEWQDGVDEAEMLAFVRDVLNSPEPMFGGGGTFYERQCQRGEIMSREDVSKQIKAGLLSYRDGPLGGCTRPGGCGARKGLGLINIACATDGCRNLIGKHSKVVRTIQLKRAAMRHIAPDSITEAMELEELEALERIEREWRSNKHSAVAESGGKKMSDILQDYLAALERLKAGKPVNVPKGTKITNDSVSLEAGRKKGTIKKSRPIFSDLITAIDAAEKTESKPRVEARARLDTTKVEVARYRALWEEALAREVSLVRQLWSERETWAKERAALAGTKVTPIASAKLDFDNR